MGGRNERYARHAGQFNVILAGAAFLDAAWLLPAFSSASLTSMRAFVDKIFNCEDLLMNFVAANLTLASAQPYLQVRCIHGTRFMAAEHSMQGRYCIRRQTSDAHRLLTFPHILAPASCISSMQGCWKSPRSLTSALAFQCWFAPFQLQRRAIRPIRSAMLQAVPVRWRIHARRLLRTGISSNEQLHFKKRTQCLATFSEHFGGSPLRVQALPGC